MTTFEPGDRVTPTGGARAGLPATAVRHDKTVDSDPLLWILFDGRDKPSLFQPNILIHIEPIEETSQ